MHQKLLTLLGFTCTLIAATVQAQSNVGTFNSVVTIRGPVNQTAIGNNVKQDLNVGSAQNSRANSFNAVVTTGSITQTGKNGAQQFINVGGMNNSKADKFDAQVTTGNIEQIGNNGERQEMDIGSVTNSTITGTATTRVTTGVVKQTGEGEIVLGAIKNSNVGQFNSNLSVTKKIEGSNIRMGSIIGQEKYDNQGRYMGQEAKHSDLTTTQMGMPDFSEQLRLKNNSNSNQTGAGSTIPNINNVGYSKNPVKAPGYTLIDSMSDNLKKVGRTVVFVEGMGEGALIGVHNGIYAVGEGIGYGMYWAINDNDVNELSAIKNVWSNSMKNAKGWINSDHSDDLSNLYSLGKDVVFSGAKYIDNTLNTINYGSLSDVRESGRPIGDMFAPSPLKIITAVNKTQRTLKAGGKIDSIVDSVKLEDKATQLPVKLNVVDYVNLEDKPTQLPIKSNTVDPSEISARAEKKSQELISAAEKKIETQVENEYIFQGGIALDINKLGMSKKQAQGFIDVAEKHGIDINLREFNKYGPKWDEIGHEMKPMSIKAKTLGETDYFTNPVFKENKISYQDYLDDYAGKVGIYNPQKLSEDNIINAIKEAKSFGINISKEDLDKLYKSRNTEWGKFIDPKHAAEVADLGSDYKLNPMGTITKIGEGRGKGLEVVGDFDVYSITDRKTGKRIDSTKIQEVWADLQAKNLVMHEDLTSWKTQKEVKDMVIKNKLVQGAEKDGIISINADGLLKRDVVLQSSNN